MIKPLVIPGEIQVDGRLVATWEDMLLIWDDVHRLLGRRYEGPQDDERIISALKERGIAPRWIDDPETKIEAGVCGWTAMILEFPA